MSLFDQLDEGADVKANSRPIWTIDLDNKENEKQILKWLVAEVQHVQQETRDRTDEIKKHYAMYKGLSAERMARSDERDRIIDRARVQRKVVINHLYDLTESVVSRIVKFKPGVAILPANDEFKDKQSAKLAKRLVDYIKYINNFEIKNQQVVRHAKVAGEGYMWIDWDKDAGPESPLSKKMELGKQEVTLVDDFGNPRTDDSGNKVKVNRPVHVGEVCYKVVRPERIIYQLKQDYEDAEYFFKINIDSVDELRLRFPKKAKDIKINKDQEEFAFDKFQGVKDPGQTIWFEFWHKGSVGLPEGRKICFTPDVILENVKHPFSHKDFPFERLPDIEVPGEQYARSFYINARQIASQINNLTTMVLRNQKIASSPKWMVPRGAVKLEQLNNDVSIVQYQGPTPPVLTQSNPTPAEIFTFRQQLKEDLQQISGVFGVSRGEPPQGIKSGVALQFLEEQENSRHNAMVANYNEYIRRVAIKTISVAGDYYDASDERSIQVFGKNDEFTLLKFDPEVLSKPFDVRIQNSSALPESKAARIQTLVDLRESFPGLVSDEQVVDLIDFGQSSKYFDEATAATRTAERENELLYEGKSIDPQEWEYHIQHWIVHVTDIQKPGFRELPKNIQDLKLDHILAHEYLMVELARKNPVYFERLNTLSQFPLLLTPDEVAPQPDVAPSADQIVEAELEQEAQIAQANAPVSQPEPVNPVLPDLEPVGEPVLVQ